MSIEHAQISLKQLAVALGLYSDDEQTILQRMSEIAGSLSEQQVSEVADMLGLLVRAYMRSNRGKAL